MAHGSSMSNSPRWTLFLLNHVESMDQGMRDLSEALPLVEQAEAALDVLDKKDRGTGGKQPGTFDWKLFAKDVQRAISRSVFRTAGQQMSQQLHIIYDILQQYSICFPQKPAPLCQEFNELKVRRVLVWLS